MNRKVEQVPQVSQAGASTPGVLAPPPPLAPAAGAGQLGPVEELGQHVGHQPAQVDGQPGQAVRGVVMLLQHFGYNAHWFLMFLEGSKTFFYLYLSILKNQSKNRPRAKKLAF